MTRRPDWQSRLERFISEHANEPFAYGSWDCCLWVCSGIREMTGVDPAYEFRDIYNTRDEAYQMIKAATGRGSVSSIVALITTKLQMPEIPVLSARRGDVVLVKRARDYSLGMVDLNGREILVCREQGLCRISLSNAVKAWRV